MEMLQNTIINDIYKHSSEKRNEFFNFLKVEYGLFKVMSYPPHLLLLSMMRLVKPSLLRYM